ncbi:interferon regulatory factor 10 [Chanos chanos]|uniref:Interferon regulatory factor 10 n=1 Tax=Chanos chanos TaxID=29144 RepID=A0A6J2UUC0_CHACN|nr:interferon regulatory factor 4-like [Chanos chanos]
MDDNNKNMRLREWLIAQINSGKYAGLSWENAEKTMFRIPWKHAAKQDYRQNEDAALFKAWAEYKGKYREGRDKADPSTWKTRLRCALNKSTDFQEVPERSQLDISEPYKVYRILAETERPTGGQVKGRLQPMTGTGTAVDKRPGVLPAPLFPPSLQISDFRLQVSVFYQGQLVQEVISTSDGCFILHGPVPVGNEQIYGPCGAAKAFFPQPDVVPLPQGIADAMRCLLPHLEKGVLVWVAPDGVFIKRFCQGRVYWNGPLAEHQDQPNKLEREKTCKLLDMHIFLLELQRYIQGVRAMPRYEIDLCFGEEFPDVSQSKNKKLITARVVPLFAKELLQNIQRPEGERPQMLKPIKAPQ